MSSLSMSRTQREAFLAGTHVAILSVADGARGPFTVPVWYRYEPGGEICFVTGGTSRKLPLIKKAGRVTFCVQTETAPYEYVTVEGPATWGFSSPWPYGSVDYSGTVQIEGTTYPFQGSLVYS